jgi:hypothetical protein
MAATIKRSIINLPVAQNSIVKLSNINNIASYPSMLAFSPSPSNSSNIEYVDDSDQDFSESDTDNSVDGVLSSSSQVIQVEPSSGAPIKKRRQRLTHLTKEEKTLRRKMANRIAAQKARDLKKIKMEDLEETVNELAKSNGNLESENKLLREKMKLLLEENRKLLARVRVSQHQEEKETDKSLLVSSNIKKRKIDNSTSVSEVVESAAFYSTVVQQKQQPQNKTRNASVSMFQQMICFLIMNIINQLTFSTISTTHAKQGDEQQSSSRVHLKQMKLKVMLIKLLRLLKSNRQNQLQHQLDKRCLQTFRNSSRKMSMLIFMSTIIKIIQSINKVHCNY